MKRKVSELEGALLDAAVAKAEGHVEVEVSSYSRGGGVVRQRCEVVLPSEDGQLYWTEYRPSADWEFAGPIIEREGLRLERFGHPGPKQWSSHSQLRPVRHNGDAPVWCMFGPAPLIAAMRVYVASKFGDEVDLP